MECKECQKCFDVLTHHHHFAGSLSGAYVNGAYEAYETLLEDGEHVFADSAACLTVCTKEIVQGVVALSGRGR